MLLKFICNKITITHNIINMEYSSNTVNSQDK